MATFYFIDRTTIIMNKLKMSQWLLMLLLTIVAIVGCSETTKAQFTSIPNVKFEQVLIAQGIDSDGVVNGQVLTSDVTGVTRLLMSGVRDITDMTGIEDFTSLRMLSIYYSGFTSINLSQNTLLDTLIIFDSFLEKLDASNLNDLEMLVCSGGGDTLVLPNNLNQLEHLDYSRSLGILVSPLVGAVNLKELDCHSSNLQSLDVSMLPSLEKLDARDNQLNYVNTQSNPLLKELNLRDNNLIQQNTSMNPLLEILNLRYNNLTTIDLQNNPLLTSLDVRASNLTVLDVSNNTLLEDIDATDNSVSQIDVSACNDLVVLRLSGNLLEQVELNDTALVGVYLGATPLLKELDIKNNTGLRGISLSGSSVTTLDLTAFPSLNEVTLENNQLQNVRLANDNIYDLWLRNNSPVLQVCFAQNDPVVVDIYWLYNAGTVFTKGCFPNKLQGKIALDTNANCTVDSAETGLRYRQVSFQKAGNAPILAATDSSGKYTIFLDTGNYVAEYVTSYNPYQQACIPTKPIVITSTTLVDTLNWSIQNLVDCANMQVDISAPLLRNTTTSSYSIQYCNQGTIAADSAYVEVELDPFLSYISATQPLTSQVGQTLHFDLGRVEADDCQRFTIVVQLDTSALFGQTHCTQAHIYPDSSCVPLWSGAILETRGYCLGDTIRFEMTNRGASMNQPTGYLVFEDNIMMRQGNVQLGSGATQSIQQAVAPGKTYRLALQQEAGFPAFLGDSITSVALEGCKPLPNGSFNTGFITQFSNGNSAPFIAVDCQQNVGSYDPNDKATQPVGYGTAHYIEKTTALDYKIRFQNTGTDTAFNIIILDTISPFLDLATLQMGASSHNYTWTIQNGNVLRVEFANIMLPDSNVNEPLSNGFFRYRIEQVANNPLGSVINNQAAIYFDYNPPIFTNTTFHTIGENFVTIQLVNTQVLEQKIDLKIYPNPFSHSTTLELEGNAYEELEVIIYDATGRVMQQVRGQGTQLQIERRNLTAGFYFYELKGDGQRLATGKVVVK